jgi:hypothetical protein
MRLGVLLAPATAWPRLSPAISLSCFKGSSSFYRGSYCLHLPGLRTLLGLDIRLGYGGIRSLLC